MHCHALSCNAQHCPALPIGLYCPTLSCTVLHCPRLSCIVLHCPALSCTVMLCPILSCIVLHDCALSCTVQHCPALACTVLHVCAISLTLPIFKTSPDIFFRRFKRDEMLSWFYCLLSELQRNYLYCNKLRYAKSFEVSRVGRFIQ